MGKLRTVSAKLLQLVGKAIYLIGEAAEPVHEQANSLSDHDRIIEAERLLRSVRIDPDLHIPTQLARGREATKRRWSA